MATDAAWYDATDARTAAGRSLPADPLLSELLTVSQEQILAYLGLDDEATPTPEQIPHSWRMAHLLHAQDLYASMQNGDRDDSAGGAMDSYTPRRPRMSGTVKNLLTPYRADVASMVG